MQCERLEKITIKLNKRNSITIDLTKPFHELAYDLSHQILKHRLLIKHINAFGERIRHTNILEKQFYIHSRTWWGKLIRPNRTIYKYTEYLIKHKQLVKGVTNKNATNIRCSQHYEIGKAISLYVLTNYDRENVLSIILNYSKIQNYDDIITFEYSNNKQVKYSDLYDMICMGSKNKNRFNGTVVSAS